jgi:hypothetical protein
MMNQRYVLKATLLVSLVGWGAFGGCASRASTSAGSPQAVIEKFLQLDSDAAGLSPSTWPEFSQYTTYTEPPKWDTFMVIDHYTLGPVTVGSERAQAQVTYYPIGKLTDHFVADTQPETVSYHLNQVDHQWKVDTQLIPHVAWDVMKRRLEAASLTNPKAKPTNDALISQISTVKQNLK